MAWTFTLASAPIEDRSTITPGLITFRTVIPGFSAQYASYVEIDCDRFIPQITRFDDHAVLQKYAGRGGAFRPTDREYIGLRIDVDEWTGAEWEAFQRLAASKRPVMFAPWYDASTVFCSLFGGMDDGGGLALVGDNAATSYVGRSASDGYPSPEGAGESLLQSGDGTTAVPKITQGHLGKAIILDRLSANVAALEPSWSVVGSGKIRTASASNYTGPVVGKVAFLPAAAANEIKYSVTGLTNGTRYVASVWVKLDVGAAASSVRFRVTHNSGAANVDFDWLTNDGAWHRVWVTWTQAGTTADLRFINTSSSRGAYVRTGPVQIEAGYLPTSWTDPTATAPTSGDYLSVSLAGSGGGDLTFAFWFRYRSSADYNYLASGKTGVGGGDRYIYHRNGFYVVRLGGSTDLSFTAAATDGEWTQLVVVLTQVAGGQGVSVYENGALLGTGSWTSSYDVLTFSGNLFIGSDKALTTPNNYGLNEAMDAVRIDGRAWTATDVQDDYDLRSTDGLRAFLAQVSGRVFRIAAVPQGFRAPDPDSYAGSLELDQIGYILPGLS